MRAVRRPTSSIAGSIVLLVALLAACGGDDGASTVATTAAPSAPSSVPALTQAITVPPSTVAVPPTASPSDPATVAAVAAVLSAVDIGDAETVDAVMATRLQEGAPEAAAAALADGVTGDAKWAAVWLYAGSGVDPQVLQPYLADDDATIRAMAAATLLSWGDVDALAVLVDLLGEDGGLYAANPPQAVWEYAAYSLDRYVDGPPITPGAPHEEVAAAWSTWIADNGASLTFDPDAGAWGVG